MNFFRLLLRCLILVVVLAAVLVAAAFIPAVQTWVVQWELAQRGSVGSVAAGLGSVTATDLQLKEGGAILTVPSLTAELPLPTAVWHRQALVRRLVAKGWTLDLSRIPEANGEGEQMTPAQNAVRLFYGALGRWTLPCDMSLDGVDLEGDVLVPLQGRAPAHVHLVVTGGGMAAGREGAFTLAASSLVVNQDFSPVTFSGRGRLAIATESPRTFRRLELKADLAASGGPFPEGFALSADIATATGAGGETYSLALGRGQRQLASVTARFSEAAQRLAGSWQLDARDSDVALFAPDHPLPHFAATGAGQFDSDLAFAQVHGAGRLRVALSQLSVLSPALERLDAVTLDAGFDAVRSGPSIRVDRLSVALAGVRPIALVQSLRPFEVDASTGEVKPMEPAGDWLKVSIRGLPLALLPMPGLPWSGGAATGEFTVRAEEGGFTLRSQAPLTVSGVSVPRVGRNLDLSLSLLADYGPAGWQIQAAPLRVERSGRPLATFDAKVSRDGDSDQPIAIAGKWEVDLRALAPDFNRIGGGSASGTFSAGLGTSSAWDGTLSVVGRDPARSLTASLHADVNSEGTVSFSAPVRIALGSSASDLSAEGEWFRDEDGPHLDVKLTGKNAVLEHVRLLAAALAALGGAPPSLGVRDRVPFWGDWLGRVTVDFDQLQAEGNVFTGVGGILRVDHGSVHLEGGHGGLATQRVTDAEGALSFDAAAAFPYHLKATAALERVEAASLFPAPEPGSQPAIDGRFSVASALTGKGINREDLLSRIQEEFQLTSTDGIVRVLKTDVNEAIPNTSAPVGDTLRSVGSVVGSLFGIKKDSVDSGKNPVSPTAQAVSDFTIEMSEIGFDQITLTAIRGSDRTIRLAAIAASAPNERLTGSGQIAYVPGLSLRAQPLSLDLQLWVHGRIAKLLSATGLLSSRKDALGYTMLSQPIHLGGTMDHIDLSQWHDLLVKAARQAPPKTKKGS